MDSVHDLPISYQVFWRNWQGDSKIYREKCKESIVVKQFFKDQNLNILLQDFKIYYKSTYTSNQNSYWPTHTPVHYYITKDQNR